MQEEDEFIEIFLKHSPTCVSRSEKSQSFYTSLYHVTVYEIPLQYFVTYGYMPFSIF